MGYKIEKDIPVPEMRMGRGGGPQYPFKSMAVGDSFIAPLNKIPSLKAAAAQFCSRHAYKRKYTTRVLQNGIRCWRIA